MVKDQVKWEHGVVYEQRVHFYWKKNLAVLYVLENVYELFKEFS